MAEASKPTTPAPPASVLPATGGPTWRASWQAPLLLASAALVTAGVVTGIITRPKADVSAMLDKATDAVMREEYESALAYLNDKVRPYLDGGVMTSEQTQDFHVLRARAVALGEQRLGIRTEENATQIAQEFAAARAQGAKLESRDMVILAHALVTLRRDDQALELVNALPVEERQGRSRVIMRIVEHSLEDAKAAPEPSLRLVAEMLASGDLDTKDRAWALARQGELLLKQQMPEAAIAKMVQTMPGLIEALEPEHAGELHRVLGRAYFDAGSLASAARQLETAAGLFLESDPRWAQVQTLLGRIDELGGDAARARSRYRGVLERVIESDAKLIPLLGLAEVHATLGEFEQSIKDYEAVVAMLDQGKRADGITRSAVGRSIMERQRTRASAGDTTSALRFAELAERAVGADAVEPEILLAIASAHRRLADAMLPAPDAQVDRLLDLSRLDPATREQARVHLASAGRYFKRHADSLGALDNESYGNSLWRAAESMDMAGDQELAIPLLNDFIRFFPADPRLAEARFRLGEAYQSRGDYATAAEQFRLLVDGDGAESRGTSAFADRAAVPLAQCLLHDNAPENDAQAEQILTAVVGGRAGSTGGERYRDALLELGALRARRNEWAAAIQLLEEAVERFPQSPSINATRYALAEAHRQDATAIQATLAEAMPDQQRVALQRTRAQRLGRAIELFDQVRASLDSKDPRRLTRLERLHLRNAYFYVGDAAFDLREFDEAIRRYDAARERFSKDPASLVAMVQIVNAYVELGDLERARTAQARARRFYDSLPAAAWSDPDLPMDKDDWQRWLDSMALLRPVQAAAGSSASPAQEQP